jgi:hypothetical protein
MRGDDQHIRPRIIGNRRDDAVFVRVGTKAQNPHPTAQGVIDLAGVEPACGANDQSRSIKEPALRKLVAQRRPIDHRYRRILH